MRPSRLGLAVALVLAATLAEAGTASKLLFSGCGGLCLLDPDNVDAGPAPFLSPDHIDQFARDFAGWCFQHAWSPDGDRIVFVTATGLPPNSDIWSVRSDGADLRQLVRQRRQCEVDGSWRTEDERYDLCLPSFYYGISWSPDGSEIVFLDYKTISFLKPEDEIQEEPSDYVDVFMFAGRTGELQESAHSVDWAPNGRIYYCSGDWDGREIWSVSRDGTDSQFVHQGCSPEVSPDGTMISFLSADGLETTGVFVVDIDGSNPRFVAKGVRSSWSPDSKRLAVIEATGRRTGLIKLINADGTNPVVVHEFAGDVVNDVDWSPWLDAPTRVSPVSWGHLKQELDP
ncbi:MAG: hypothetical protein OXG13_16905 [Gemmatimonadaceae bacterium]|nr:hypothetical protein [Gemmatimonadaceae bacterium]